MSKKINIEQLKKEISLRLSSEQKKLLPFISMNSQKDYIQFRVPEGVFELETLWSDVERICKELSVEVKRHSTFATAAELIELLSDIEFLWENWIPYGMVTLLIAQPGLGKSAIALDLIRRVTEGSPMPLSGLGSEPKSTVWVEAENAQQILMMRVKSMGIDANKIFMPIIDGSILSTPKLNNEAHRNEIKRIVEAKKPSLLIIDSLGGAKDGGENKVEEVKPFFDFITGLARDSEKLAIVLIHHFNKGGDESSTVRLNKVRGSSLISASCRSIIALDQPRPNEIKMELIKSNVAPPQKSLSLCMLFDDHEDISGVEYDDFVDTPQKMNKTERCSEWLLNFLKDNESPVRVKDIIEAAKPDYSRQNLYAAKSKLSSMVFSEGSANNAVWGLVGESDAVRQIHGVLNGR